MQLEFDSIIEEITPKQEKIETQTKLDIDQHGASPIFTQLAVGGPCSLFTWEPPKSVTFSDGKNQCGSFTWEDGVFKFEGKAEESAKIFANYVGQFLGMKIPS